MRSGTILHLFVALILGSATPCLSQSLNEIIRLRADFDLERYIEENQPSKEEINKALIAAAGLNRSEFAQILINKGASVHFKILSRTALIVAVTEGSNETVRVLLEAGSDPNTRGWFEWTPLHYSINNYRGDPDIIKMLIDYGADVNAITNLQVTPLHRAATFCKAEAARVLIENGADTSLVDKDGGTAESRARLSGCW